jgi:curved DNA-binding protein CbpA
MQLWCQICVLLISVSAVLSVNFYTDLGVDRRASSREIREAFHQLALKYHPDRNPNNPEAEEKFIKIAQGNNLSMNSFLRETILICQSEL